MRISLVMLTLIAGCSRSPGVRNLSIAAPKEAAVGDVTLSALGEFVARERIAFAWTATTSAACKATFSDPSKATTHLHLDPGCGGSEVTIVLNVKAADADHAASQSMKVVGPRPVQSPPTHDAATPAGARLVLPLEESAFFGIGEFVKQCAGGENGSLVLGVKARAGDYAGCCVSLADPLDVTHHRRAKVRIDLQKEEAVLHLKFERGPAGTDQQAFVFAGKMASGEREVEKVITSDFVASRIDRFCVVALGPGPTPNAITVRSVSFE